MAQVLILSFRRFSNLRMIKKREATVWEAELVTLIGVLMASKVHQNLRESCNSASKLKKQLVQYSEEHVERLIIVKRVVW